MDTTSQPRIVIEDLPAEQPLTEAEMAALMGAGRFRPNLEQLETREVMSATIAGSTLGGVAVSFSLNNGILSETSGPHVGVHARGVQGLFQGRDAAGHEVVYDQVGGYLNEYSPSRGWVGDGAANQVQDINDAIFFTRNGALFLASGTPAQRHTSSTTSRACRIPADKPRCRSAPTSPRTCRSRRRRSPSATSG